MLLRLLLISILSCLLSEQVTAATSVVVKAGDTLSSIAQEKLGDAGRWVTLCDLNRDVLSDCNTLPIGVVLKTKSVDISEEVDEDAEGSEVTGGAVLDYVTNGAFSNGLIGWDSREDADVTKSILDGQLVLSRAPTGDIAGAAAQMLSLKPDTLYEMKVNVFEAPAAFRITNSDQSYVQLDVGANTVLVRTSPTTEGEWLLYFWPLSNGSSVRIDDVSIVDVPSN